MTMLAPARSSSRNGASALFDEPTWSLGGGENLKLLLSAFLLSHSWRRHRKLRHSRSGGAWHHRRLCVYVGGSIGNAGGAPYKHFLARRSVTHASTRAARHGSSTSQSSKRYKLSSSQGAFGNSPNGRFPSAPVIYVIAVALRAIIIGLKRHGSRLPTRGAENALRVPSGADGGDLRGDASPCIASVGVPASVENVKW